MCKANVLNCIYRKFRIGASNDIKGAILSILRPEWSISGKVFLVALKCAGDLCVPGSSQAKTLQVKLKGLWYSAELVSRDSKPQWTVPYWQTEVASVGKTGTWFPQSLNRGSWLAWRWSTFSSAEKNKSNIIFFGVVPLNRNHSCQKYKVTFLCLPGVTFPTMRLLDGVLTAVPYNMSSWVCLLFFSCWKNKLQKWTNNACWWRFDKAFGSSFHIPAPFSLSPSRCGASPTAAAHNPGTSVHWQRTLCLALAPKNQFGP